MHLWITIGESEASVESTLFALPESPRPTSVSLSRGVRLYKM